MCFYFFDVVVFTFIFVIVSFVLVDWKVLYNLSLCLTCPAPVSDSSRVLVGLPGLLQDVPQPQHASAAHGVGEQQVPALEQRLPAEPDADHKLFTRPVKHDVWTVGRVLSSAGRHTLSGFLCGRSEVNR